MALEQETKDMLWFGGYPLVFLLLLFAGALWIATVSEKVDDHIGYEDSVLGARAAEVLDFGFIQDSTERYEAAVQYYQTVFWNSLDTVQRSYLEKIETYQDSLNIVQK